MYYELLEDYLNDIKGIDKVYSLNSYKESDGMIEVFYIYHCFDSYWSSEESEVITLFDLTAWVYSKTKQK